MLGSLCHTEHRFLYSLCILCRRRGSIPKANFLPSKVFGDDVQEELFGPWQSCGDSLATETLKAGHEERPRQVLAMSQVFAQRLHTCHTKSDVLVQKALKKLVDAKKDLCMQGTVNLEYLMNL